MTVFFFLIVRRPPRSTTTYTLYPYPTLVRSNVRTAEPEANRDAILCLVATELTHGATTTTYAPRANVTRRQMSLFVQRLADLLDSLETGEPELEELPEYDPAELSYPDVAVGSSGAEAIGQLSQVDRQSAV